jgi:Lrp/AsnC family transcriptional regulator for asnA, asnC and gidA
MIANWIWGEKLYKIEKLDYAILSILTKNCRTPITEIANTLKTTVSTINHHLKHLEQELPIAYSINIDWSKLGYRWFHLQISLNDYNKKNEIIKYMRRNPYLIRRFKFLDLTMDLHFTLLLKDMNHLRSIIKDITATFPDVINDYQFYSTYKVYKYKFLIPEILTQKNPTNQAYVQ